MNNSNPLVLRDFSIEQLLCRESVEIDMTEISNFITGKERQGPSHRLQYLSA